MQLVLSNNRIIAHGENFLAMGGVVINTETGARYENATIAECNGCPSDIDKVGYEYHAGIFVPCAPFAGTGNNNGYFMEVCEDCATPRNSGIPIKGIYWNKLGSVSENLEGVYFNESASLNFSIPASVLFNYSRFRFILRAGASFKLYNLTTNESELPSFDFRLTIGSGIRFRLYCNMKRETNPYEFTLDKDVILPTVALVDNFGKHVSLDGTGNVFGEEYTMTQLNSLGRSLVVKATPGATSKISYTIDVEGAI